jgi:hypoxanthine phosphoribosyltransferase
MSYTQIEASDILYSSEEIMSNVQRLANEINTQYNGVDNLVIVGVLNGAFMFFSDLLKLLNVDCYVDFMSLKSYKNNKREEIKLIKGIDIEIDPNDMHILVIDDVVDSGHTMVWLQNYFNTLGVNSVRFCCLIDKPSGRDVDFSPDFSPDFIGMTMTTDDWIYGYGMDLDGKQRNLPMVMKL